MVDSTNQKLIVHSCKIIVDDSEAEIERQLLEMFRSQNARNLSETDTLLLIVSNEIVGIFEEKILNYITVIILYSSCPASMTQVLNEKLSISSFPFLFVISISIICPFLKLIFDALSDYHPMKRSSLIGIKS